MAAQIRRLRVRADQVREAARGRHRRLVDAIADARAIPAVDQQGVQAVHNVVVERAAATCRVCAAGQQRPLDLEAAIIRKRLGHIHHQVVLQQQLGQRVLSLLVQRPVDRAVQAVEERQVRRSAARDRRRHTPCSAGTGLPDCTGRGSRGRG